MHEVDYKIFGDDMQYVEVELDPGEAAIAEAGGMMYMDDGIGMETIFGDGSAGKKGFIDALVGAGKRLLTGESLFMTVFLNRDEKLAFASPYPGKIIPIHLPEIGGELIAQKDSFLCAAKGVSIGIAFQKRFGVGLFGGEGFIMERLQGDGLAFVNAGGTIHERVLSSGELVRVDTGCIVALQPSVEYDIEMVRGIKSAIFMGRAVLATARTGKTGCNRCPGAASRRGPGSRASWGGRGREGSPGGSADPRRRQVALIQRRASARAAWRARGLLDAVVDRDAAVGVPAGEQSGMLRQAALDRGEPLRVAQRVLRDPTAMPEDPDEALLRPEAHGRGEIDADEIEEVVVRQVERRGVVGAPDHDRQEHLPLARAPGEDARRPERSQDPRPFPARHEEAEPVGGAAEIRFVEAEVDDRDGRARDLGHCSGHLRVHLGDERARDRRRRRHHHDRHVERRALAHVQAEPANAHVPDGIDPRGEAKRLAERARQASDQLLETVHERRQRPARPRGSAGVLSSSPQHRSEQTPVLGLHAPELRERGADREPAHVAGVDPAHHRVHEDRGRLGSDPARREVVDRFVTGILAAAAAQRLREHTQPRLPRQDVRPEERHRPRWQLPEASTVEHVTLRGPWIAPHEAPFEPEPPRQVERRRNVVEESVGSPLAGEAVRALGLDVSPGRSAPSAQRPGIGAGAPLIS
jgi:uncharacterized protein (AIM24 family)